MIKKRMLKDCGNSSFHLEVFVDHTLTTFNKFINYVRIKHFAFVDNCYVLFVILK